MKWHKIGMVFCPNNNYPWMVTHASNPVAERIDGDFYRVYFSCRDRWNRSSIGYVEIDATNPSELVRISQKPVLTPGATGLFDDSGTSVACIVRNGEKRYLYYLGWNLCITVPWRNSIGLAISEAADKPFIKFSRTPILDRNEIDPFSLSYPWVISTGSSWGMWYGSNLSWGASKSDMKYVIKYAESANGISWDRDGHIALQLNLPVEYAFARPCVIVDKDLFRMWYSFRGKSYRIGYAESSDGLHWERKDEQVGIEVSESGWDLNFRTWPES